MPGKAVLILGGGVGGLVTANKLRQRLGREHQVVLLDHESKHIFWPKRRIGPKSKVSYSQ